MHIEKKTIKQIFLAACGAVVLYWILHETQRVAGIWNSLKQILSPFIIGSVMAFILNVPMRAIESKLSAIQKPGLRRGCAILLTFVAFLIVVAGVFGLLIPQLVTTVQTLIPTLTEFFQRVEVKAIDFLNENPQLMSFFSFSDDSEGIDWSNLLQQAVTILKNSVTVIASGAFSAVGSVAGALVDIVIGFVFALYCLSSKETLAGQGRKLLYALLPEGWADQTIRVLRLTNITFSNFLSGQCLEAVILGCLFAVAMAIFKMPYISLISVLIAVTALIPLVGAFIGCFLGAFFILVNDPFQAVIFVIMFLVLQQIEGNLIYPKVVGTSIGLPGMWVLVAVTVGGDIMGVAGMFIMIPISSVLYALLREYTNAQLAKREIDPAKLMPQPPEVKSKFREKREQKKQQALLKQMKELAEKAAANAHIAKEKHDETKNR